MNKFVKIVGAVAIINIVARFFGFLREMIIGFQYGTGHTSDSIFTAYMIPNFLYLVVGGAFTTVFISIYNRETTDKGLFVKQSFTIVVMSAIIMTLIGMAFANPILESFNTGKVVSDDQLALTRNLYYWMMPSSIFLVLSSWYSGLLNVNQRFHLSSFAILIYNAIFLVIAVVLSETTIGPMGYGISALVSAVLMVYFLVIGYRKLDSFKVGFSFKHNVSTKELWIMVVPIMLGGATIQLYALLQRYVAGLLSLEGAVSSVNYASKLMQFPQAILITAVTTVIYPILSHKEAENDHASIKSLYSKGLQYLFLLLIPVTIYSYFYSTNLIQVVFEYNKFNAKATAITAPVLAVFVLSMYFLAANTYITRFYYAKGDSMAPVIFSLLNVFGVNIGAIFLLVDSTGVVSIAWGTLISSVVNFIMLIVYASFKYDLKMGIFSKELQFFRAMPPMIIITIVMYFSSKYLVFEYKWITFIVGLVIFSAVLVGSFLLFGVKEVKEFSDKLKKKFLK
ncbi:murein biosynthesis integral membrane protein MurJ [Lysinibacillus sp. NPDC092081]|uniref:murein biosynthesis integral membrane protein MurJ n=1 Tax=Lysinibacillus sp. NPDC092081 TaxID=3364131 RepID=UPI003827D5B3